MILTATPSTWSAMRALPLPCRFGAAPPELLACLAAQPATAAGPQFLAALSGVLAALPPVLKSRIDAMLLGVFYLRGLDGCVATDVLAASDGSVIGVAVAVGEHEAAAPGLTVQLAAVLAALAGRPGGGLQPYGT